MGLGENDAILVLNIGGEDAYLATGDYFASMLDDDMVSKYLDEFLYAPFMAGDYDESVLALYEGIHDRYVSSFGMGDGDAYMGYEDPNVYYVETGFGTFFFFLILVLVLLIVADGRRYRRYRSGYYGPT